MFNVLENQNQTIYNSTDQNLIPESEMNTN